MGKYRSTLILFLILSVASFYTDELARLCGEMGLYIGVIQFNNPAESESITRIEFHFEEDVSNSLEFFQEPAGWRCYKDGTSFNLINGVLNPRESVTIQLSCDRYFPFLDYPFVANGFTTTNAALPGDGRIKFNDVIPLRVLFYISRSPNQSILFLLTGVFFVLELISTLRDRKKKQVPTVTQL